MSSKCESEQSSLSPSEQELLEYCDELTEDEELAKEQLSELLAKFEDEDYDYE